MSTFYIYKMIPYQFIQFSKEFKVLLSLFYNDVASISLNGPYKTVELFIYFQYMSYNGTEVLEIYFWFFLILSNVHIRQFRIIFGNHVEIDLYDRK
jgi:hypothetical protein